jgi:hypothetical protein
LDSGNIYEKSMAIANAKTKLVSRSEIPVGSTRKSFHTTVPREPLISDAITPAL